MSQTHCLSEADFAVPREQRYFEDYLDGAVYEYGTVVMSAAAMIDFASRFDPQPMHTDPPAALRGPTRGLIASGMHTASLCIRLMVDHYLSGIATLPSPGMNSMSFLVPVRPEDALRLRTEVTATRPSRSDPDRGLVTTAATMLNQEDRAVLRLDLVHLILRRPR